MCASEGAGWTPVLTESHVVNSRLLLHPCHLQLTYTSKSCAERGLSVHNCQYRSVDVGTPDVSHLHYYPALEASWGRCCHHRQQPLCSRGTGHLERTVCAKFAPYIIQAASVVRIFYRSIQTMGDILPAWNPQHGNVVSRMVRLDTFDLCIFSVSDCLVHLP